MDGEDSSYDDAVVEADYFQHMVLLGCMLDALVVESASSDTYVEVEDVGIVQRGLYPFFRTVVEIEQDAFFPYYYENLRLRMPLIEAAVVAMVSAAVALHLAVAPAKLVQIFPPL